MGAVPELEVAKHRVKGFASKWHKLMDMNWLSLHHTFNPNYNEEEKFVVATTEMDWEYRAGVIDWHLPRVAAISDKTLEAVVVHEYVHCLVAPIEVLVKDKDSKLCEYSVESLARAMLNIERGRRVSIPRRNLPLRNL